jgi:hypothetical protein
MNEMYRDRQIKTGGYKMPPAPPFVRVNGSGFGSENEHINAIKEESRKEEKGNEKVTQNKVNKIPKQTVFDGANRFPFLKNGILDKDISLILGLILILANEKADRKLLLALLYILM